MCAFPLSVPGNGYVTTDAARASVLERSISDARTSPDSASWFALWTRSRHEQAVCNDLDSLQVEAFLPTVIQVSQWKDRKKRIARPLFPGYCFARFDGSRMAAVRRCKGLVGVLSDGRRPLAVPEHEISALQRLVQSGLSYKPCSTADIGRFVRVVTGPLRGVVGRLVRNGPQDHIVIAVEILNSGARVHVAAEDIILL